MTPLNDDDLKFPVFKFFIVAIIFSACIGYSIAYFTHIKTTDEQINYIENKLNNSDYGYSILNDNLSIGTAKFYYLNFKFVSRYMLSRELENICGTKPTNKYKIIPSLNICEDICKNQDY